MSTQQDQVKMKIVAPAPIREVCGFCRRTEALDLPPDQKKIRFYVLWHRGSNGKLAFSENLEDFLDDMPEGYKQNVLMGVNDERMISLCVFCIREIAALGL